MIKQFSTLSSGPDMKTVAMKTVEVDNWSYLIGDGHKKTDARVGAREDSDLAFLWQQNLAGFLPLLLADTLLQLVFSISV